MLLVLQLQQLARALSGRLLTIDAPLTTAVIEVLLAGGCSAVMCQRSEDECDVADSDAAGFFLALYQQLHAGRHLLQASHL